MSSSSKRGGGEASLTSKRAFRPGLENLEDRCLPSTAALVHGVLIVRGTAAADVIRVRQMNNVVRVDGIQGTWSAATVNRIVVDAGSGADRVFLNSETISGHQPLSMPCSVKGGAGNDIIFGSAKGDTLLGDLGDDVIYGRGGNDRIEGNAGRDSLFGDAGADVITVNEFTDATLRGGAGSDQIVYAGIDPSQITTNAGLLKDLLNNSGQLEQLGFHYHDGDGHWVTVKNVSCTAVTMADGKTTLEMRADYRYQDTRGLLQFSASGSVKLSLRPVLNVIVTEVGVHSAVLTLTEMKIKEVTVNNVPNWADDLDFIKNKMAAQLANLTPPDVTALAQAYLAASGGLSNASA